MSLPAALTSTLHDLIFDRLGNWPPQWEGFHWPGYTYEHTLRVRNLALGLAAEEHANPDVVEVAALLHDIAKAEGREHATIGAEQAASLLAGLDLDPGFIEPVRYAIATHSGDNTEDHPAENRVLGDADLIDANFGLVATWRFITIRAGRQSTLQDTIDGMIEWLPKKDELMALLRSDAGRRLAAERSRVMHESCSLLADVFAGRSEDGDGLRRIVNHIASDYHRASLKEQLPVLQSMGTDDNAQAFCARLEAEISGQA